MADFIKNDSQQRLHKIEPYSFPCVAGDKAQEVKEKTCVDVDFKRICFDGDGNLIEISQQDNQSNKKAEINPKDIEDKAYIEGYAKGETEGLEASRRRVEDLLNSLETALSDVVEIRRNLTLAAEKEAVELAIAVAKKIVNQEIKTDRAVIVNVIKKALQKAEGHDKIKIKMSNLDFQFLKEYKMGEADFLKEIGNVTFEGDASIRDGGCVVQTNLGEIDARIEQQLQSLEDEFRAELKKIGMGGL